MSFGGKWRTCPYYVSTQSNLPQQPLNLMRFVLFGYVYSETPVFFNKDGEMINLQYTADVNTLSYTWTFYKKDNEDVCNLNLILVTSEDIIPNIYEEISGKYMIVTRLNRINGRTRWLIYC